MAAQSRNYLRIVSLIYLMLPYTLVKQKFFWRFRKPQKNLPHFLCIGAQKSATTWLHHQLAKHPGICMPDIKEVHYFDWFFYRSLSWYGKYFEKCGDKIRGEITPGYSVIEKGRIKFLARIMPEVKIILVLRDPVERAWSSARFHFAKEKKRRMEEVSHEELIAHFNLSWVRQRGDYTTILKKWKEIIPSHNLLVLLHEDLSSDPQLTLNRIHDFVGAEDFAGADLTARYNVSEEMAMPDDIRAYLTEYYAGMVSELRTEHRINTSVWKNYNPE